MTGVLDALAVALGPRAQRDVALGARTTYRVGGRAALWVEADSTADLVALHEALVRIGAAVPFLVVGKGSNLLVADAGFPGIVVSLGASYDYVELHGEVARAGAATGYPVLARRSAAAGLVGLEWAVGIPGSVGGALRMNAGGHGADTAHTLARYSLFDMTRGQELEIEASQFHAGYRHSSLGDTDVALWAEFALRPGDADAAGARVKEIVSWRRANQPGGSNAGSVFTNPPEAPAGQLIEKAGCKGLRIGSAEVSAKHANFIQADENGSADDVRRVMEAVRERVWEEHAVRLTTEVRLIGFDDVALPEVMAEASSPSGRGSS
ncbi:MAG: UDP-N-acetylmuramate dehydrogenase [Acidimicrobiales bacterium]